MPWDTRGVRRQVLLLPPLNWFYSLNSDRQVVSLGSNQLYTRNILTQWPHIEPSFCSYNAQTTEYKQKEMVSHEKSRSSGFVFSFNFQILQYYPPFIECLLCQTHCEVSFNRPCARFYVKCF